MFVLHIMPFQAMERLSILTSLICQSTVIVLVLISLYDSASTVRSVNMILISFYDSASTDQII